MRTDTRHLGIQTRAIHAGEFPDPYTGATTPNLVMASTFRTDAKSQFSIADQDYDGDPSYIYTRWGNPTIDQLGKKLSALEGTERCLLFSSGMAAITNLFLHVLKKGDHLLMSDVSYAGASELANEILSKLAIEISRVNMSDIEEVRSELRSNTKLVYVETPCNPICRLTDLKAIADLAHQVGAKLAVDSTFATPLGTRPMELGADFIIHALTKFIGGHGDAMGGALLGARQILADLHQTTAVRLGSIISPFNAWLIMRGIATLPLRMRMHAANAMKIAQFLEAHPKISKVIYPGLSSHPQHTLAKKQMSNFSGMLTFQMAKGRQAAQIFAEHLGVFHYAVSLGHHKSLLFYLDTSDLLKSSFRLTYNQEASYREYAGDGIFRVSIGLENSEDLCDDLKQSLERL